MKVAIDGPAGSGKSTIAKSVAKKLGFLHIDTGAFYRWVTYNVLLLGISLKDHEKIITIAKTTKFNNITENLIRSTEVTQNVSEVSAIKGVREVVVDKQRELAADHNVVMEGRDIGSVVFPDAEVKVFLNASADERAQRRYLEVKDDPDFQDVDLEKIKSDIIERDKYDSNRDVSPLVKTADAVEIDTTGLSIDEVTVRVLEIVSKKVHYF